MLILTEVSLLKVFLVVVALPFEFAMIFCFRLKFTFVVLKSVRSCMVAPSGFGACVRRALEHSTVYTDKRKLIAQW
jgi:hypothetical protein